MIKRFILDLPFWVGAMAVLLIGFSLFVPSLGQGFFLDDWAQLSLLRDTPGGVAWDLYSFLGELPIHPWWKHPEFHVAMWRPLASLSLTVDYRLFGLQALPFHVNSLLWWIALMATVGLLYRRYLGGSLGLLALLLYSLDESHNHTTIWIANRHSMIAMVPSLLGLVAYLRWREDGWRPGLPLSLIGFAVGLAGSEVALGVLAYVAAFELTMIPKERLADWRPFLPVSLLAIAYVVFYKLGGYGAANCGFYLDTGSPSALIAGISQHFPVLLAAGLVGFPADLFFFAPASRPIAVALGIGALLAGCLLFYRLREEFSLSERRLATWGALGAMASLLPSTIAQPFDRMLITPMVGIAMCLALLLDKLRSRFSRRQWAGILCFCLLVLLHGVLPVGHRLLSQHLMAKANLALARVKAETLTLLPENATTVIVPVAPDIAIAGYVGLMLRLENHRSIEDWSTWSLAPTDHTLRRTGERSFELQTHEGVMMASEPEYFHRPRRRPLVVGEELKAQGVAVRVLETSPEGVRKIAILLDRDPTELHFLEWRDGQLKILELPAVGQEVLLRHENGPLFPG